MKVIIDVSFESLKGESYFGRSKVIEWPFDVLPFKGDLLDIDEFEELTGKLEYKNIENEKAIQGNLFPYKEKQFAAINRQAVIILYFDEGDNEQT